MTLQALWLSEGVASLESEDLAAGQVGALRGVLASSLPSVKQGLADKGYHTHVLERSGLADVVYFRTLDEETEKKLALVHRALGYETPALTESEWTLLGRPQESEGYPILADRPVMSVRCPRGGMIPVDWARACAESAGWDVVPPGGVLWAEVSPKKGRTVKDLTEWLDSQGLEYKVYEMGAPVLSESGGDFAGDEAPCVPTKRKKDDDGVEQENVQYIRRGNTYTPVGDVVLAGALQEFAYQVQTTMNGTIQFTKVKPRTDELYTFPSSAMDKVLNEVDRLWGLKDNFKKLGFLHNRGILLYGAPGTGKAAGLVR
jgi:hypothetical protein